MLCGAKFFIRALLISCLNHGFMVNLYSYRYTGIYRSHRTKVVREDDDCNSFMHRVSAGVALWSVIIDQNLGKR